MIARIYKPGPPLGAFVDCLWHFHGYTAVHKRERALPTGTVEIVVSLRDDPIQVFGNDADAQGQRFGGAIVCGAQSGYFELDTSQEESVIGVHFKPGGAARGNGVEGAAVVLDAGFCDQSHLNRDFRAFSGVTPTDYRPVSDDRPSHVAIDE